MRKTPPNTILVPCVVVSVRYNHGGFPDTRNEFSFHADSKKLFTFEFWESPYLDSKYKPNFDENDTVETVVEKIKLYSSENGRVKARQEYAEIETVASLRTYHKRKN